MVAGADQRAPVAQPRADVGQFAERARLPGQVVEAGLAGDRPGGLAADGEQPQVVVVEGAGRAQERGLPGVLGGELEAEDVLVELDRALDVADVEHGVVEAADWHGGSSG